MKIIINIQKIEHLSIVENENQFYEELEEEEDPDPGMEETPEEVERPPLRAVAGNGGKA